MTEPTSNDTAKDLLKTALPNADITVKGDGYKYDVTIIDETFDGLNILARHKLVYKALDEEISSGKLHALTITAKTPKEAANG